MDNHKVIITVPSEGGWFNELYTNFKRKYKLDELELEVQKYDECNHIMVDIETLGTEPGCAILSISAVMFNIETGYIAAEWEFAIDLETSPELSINPKTALWWLSQSKEAQDRLLKLQENKISAKEALVGFNNIFGDGGKQWKNKYHAWGNSARFDLGIIEFAMSKYGITPNWHFGKERDVRTLLGMVKDIYGIDLKNKDILPFEGVAHNGLDDCKHQIRQCSMAYNILKSDQKKDSNIDQFLKSKEKYDNHVKEVNERHVARFSVVDRYIVE